MMSVLLRLDLDRVRINLEAVARVPQTEEDVLRFLAAMGVSRRDEQWFVTTEATSRAFSADELLETRPDPRK
jgi:hypothetical protein